MLDLEARVHLEEEVLALAREEAFDRPRRAVPDGTGGVDRDPADLGAELLVDGRGRRLLDELLVAALDRAVALAEMDDGSVPVGEHLHLDVTRVVEVALDVDGRVGEVRLPFAASGLERALDLVRRGDDLEALPSAAGRGLDRDRPADLVAEPANVGGSFDGLGRAGDDRDAGGAHRLARRNLGAHQLHRLRRRADPDEPGSLDGTREVGVLGEKPVPGMNRLGAGPLRGVDDPLLVQVALGRRPGADEIRLVRERCVERSTVGYRVDRDRRDLQLAERPADANCDLAAVGDQNLGEGLHLPRILQSVSFADQLTLARAAAVPFVVLLYVWDFPNHDYWATALFALAMATDWFDGRLARRSGRTSALGSLLDPVADKLLVLTVMIVLVGRGVFTGWIVAAIVARELLVSGLRLAALERGVVLEARDLGRLKTWTQAVAAGLGGLAAAGAFDDRIAEWALVVALILTWVSGLDYARLAPRLLRGDPTAGSAQGAKSAESTFSSSPASRQTLP